MAEVYQPPVKQRRYEPRPQVLSSQLTRRETDCVAMLARGWHSAEIARLLGLRFWTARNYLASATTKLECSHPGQHTRINVARWFLTLPAEVQARVNRRIGP